MVTPFITCQQPFSLFILQRAFDDYPPVCQHHGPPVPDAILRVLHYLGLVIAFVVRQPAAHLTAPPFVVGTLPYNATVVADMIQW